jgi:hypothetical protein
MNSHEKANDEVQGLRYKKNSVNLCKLKDVKVI